MRESSKLFNRIPGSIMTEILQDFFPMGIIPHSQFILHRHVATLCPECERENFMSMPKYKFSVHSKTSDP